MLRDDKCPHCDAALKAVLNMLKQIRSLEDDKRAVERAYAELHRKYVGPLVEIERAPTDALEDRVNSKLQALSDALVAKQFRRQKRAR